MCHVFRVFAADAAHAATDMTEFKPQVEADYKLEAAAKLAKEQAEKLQVVAQGSGLDAASVSSGRKLMTTGEITVHARRCPDASVAAQAESSLTLRSRRVRSPEECRDDQDRKSHRHRRAAPRRKGAAHLPHRDHPAVAVGTGVHGRGPTSRARRPSFSNRISASNGSTAKKCKKRLNYKPEKREEKPTAG